MDNTSPEASTYQLIFVRLSLFGGYSHLQSPCTGLELVLNNDRR